MSIIVKEIIYRFEPNCDKEYLNVVKKKNVTIIKGKKYAEHGYLTDTKNAGNGYHGRCSNCGLPCVTDLGYYSFDGVSCETKDEAIATIDYKFRWSKSIEKATKLNRKDAMKHFSKLIIDQGWGKYNFQIIKDE